ncbi:DUF309 domain-containing protein [Halorientalis sp.]|uniref:DUF309 domain-containing protein n=1 Tax=Halorientalis sp. TaxID=1931229 RepID=UPI002605F743|nr:DUF309 domain-containing protein [Halorientalis sp.]
METALRAGVAIFNAGDYHEAHDAWEDHWLALDSGTDDERFLHGLIQFTAAVHHASERNWPGVTGLTESARDYLAGLPADYRGVDLAGVRAYLQALAADPERIERARPLELTHEGEALALSELDFAESAAAAAVYAEDGQFDEVVVEQGIEYARDALDDGAGTSPFVTFVMDFARDPAHRGIIYQRLSEHIQRRQRRESDVDGLF